MTDPAELTDGWANMSHLLGWWERMPEILDEECPICHAAPGDGHRIVTLGKGQTIRLLLEAGHD